MSTNLNVRDLSENSNDDNTSITIENKKRKELIDKICMVAAEVIGTGLLTFFGCMGCINWFGITGFNIVAPLNFGLTVMFIIQIFGHISYAIINPAVVIVAVVHRYISITVSSFITILRNQILSKAIQMGILFVIAEIVGATLGYGLLYALTPAKYIATQPGLCTTVVHDEITITQAFFIEFFLTFTLILIISGVWDPRNRDNGDSIPVRIGESIN